MRDHQANQAAEQRRNSAQARARRLQAAQAKVAAVKQRDKQVNPVAGESLTHCNPVRLHRL